MTNYTYNDAPLPAFEKATTNGKWVKKTKDGLGWVVLVETGNGTTTVSKVTTEYAPCSCSPLGRVWRVSQPYTTSPTAWTTYTYDALGRTTCVSLPGNSGSTTYAYEGNAVTVTDPAGRWKKYETDAFGNVTKVTEPNPQSGANHETMYAYDMFNRLTTVTMPRGGTTQTRTFAYNTLGQLQSTVNPENGTTTLAYNTDGTLFSRTDQKAQRIEYSYDSFRRVSQVRKYQSNGLEDTCQRVNYYYDTNPYESTFTQNGWGRLAVVEYGGSSCTGGRYRESFSYTPGGLPVKKKLWVYDGTIGNASLLAQWSYDSEGKILTVKHPDTYDNNYNLVVGRTYTQTYDEMGRPRKVTDDQAIPVEWAKDAAYGPAGELTQLWLRNEYGGYMSEARTYNTRLQLTGIQWGPGFLGAGRDLFYSYNDTANDGRITQMQRVEHYVYNPPTTYTTGYTYDSLGRLATGGTASYTYDGFGNRLQQTSPAMYLSYNASNNRITTSGYSYDSNGNLTGAPDLTMSYDVENRLVQAQTPTVTENYRYAPSGQRVWKSGLMEGGIYLWGVDGKLIGLYRLRQVLYGEPVPVWITVMQEQWTNVYLGGRIVRDRNVSVVPDRLGTRNMPASYPYGDGGGLSGYYPDGTTGLDYAQQRYYASTIGRFTTADPYMPSAAITRPQSWNRYAYVSNDPVNKVDPTGLCSAMLAGITMDMDDSSPFDNLQIQLGAVAGFPYSELGELKSIGSVLSQALSGPNDSTAVATKVLSDALKGTTGSIDIIAYSGGAQAFTTAYGLLNDPERARIGSILYISPGAGGTLATTADLNKTSVVMGTGGSDLLATIGTTIPAGVSTTWTKCSHTDLACLLKEAKPQIAQIASGGACAYQDVFRRTTERGSGSARSGSIFPMLDNARDYQVIWDFIDPE